MEFVGDCFVDNFLIRIAGRNVHRIDDGNYLPLHVPDVGTPSSLQYGWDNELEMNMLIKMQGAY
jgi:hypothetical protein